jgi:hypothetical protein
MDAFWKATDQWKRLRRNVVCFATFWKMLFISSPAKESVAVEEKIEYVLI